MLQKKLFFCKSQKYEKLNSRKTPFFVGVLKDEIYNLGLETGIKDAIVIDLDTEIRIDGYEEKLFCPIVFLLQNSCLRKKLQRGIAKH
ncbi:hypothetical protein MHBO_000575 [Bonamia ostreae]|uniref:Uncharacterized protein n=1 Tax=Bonamia ostreae TaxID=126728 RepID=A0ABV2AG21_9EUKA